jgi:hypothetical protein
MRIFRSGWAGAGALGAAMLIGSGLSAPSAEAAYIVTLTEDGSGNVDATGSGTIDLTGLGLFGPVNAVSQLHPSIGLVYIGPTSPEPANIFTGATGPTSFGNGFTNLANSGSGDMVGIAGKGGELLVPAGYVSGNLLSDSSTYNNATLAGLEVTPGQYVWTWGSGADADSFTLQIGAVPAPSIGRGLPVLLAVGGLLFGAKSLERIKKHGLQFG